MSASMSEPPALALCDTLITLIRDTKAALTGDRAQLEREKAGWLRQGSNRPFSGNRVQLNVGGMRYSTSPATLKADEGSLLAALVSGRWETRTCADGSIFLDRDGRAYEEILNFLRDGTLSDSLSEVKKARLLREAEFLNLSTLVAFLGDGGKVTNTSAAVQTSTPPAQDNTGSQDLVAMATRVKAACAAERAAIDAERAALAEQQLGWEAMEAKLERAQVTVKDLVRLDVGGSHYCCALSTLCAVPGSSLANMFAAGPSDLAEESGEVFIDRAGPQFAHVLEFLRDGSVDENALSREELDGLAQEAAFFGLDALSTIAAKPAFRPGQNFTLDPLQTATKTGANNVWDATVLGPQLQPDMPLTMRVLRAQNMYIMVGLAPPGITETDNNYLKCGWYLYCYNQTLFTPGNQGGRYGRVSGRLASGATVGVRLAASGAVSFIVNGADCGVACNVPPHQPYRLAVLFNNVGDQVQLIT